MTPTPTASRGAKRTLPDQSVDSPTPSLDFKGNEQKTGRPPKRSRLQKAQNDPLKDANEKLPEAIVPAPQEGSITASIAQNRDKSASVHLLEDEQAGTPSKRRRVASSDRSTLQSPTPRLSDVPTPRSGQMGPQTFNFGTKPVKKAACSEQNQSQDLADSR
ncbi:hypothetical protein HAV15_001797 [Penicillium sp. str. |nr:hypothetical protein HAV15_001797 [Penicillium sp. str. \